jgi:hypothetical protein
MLKSPWYYQCVPLGGTPDEPLPGVPDAPIETTSFQTVITITPTANSPTVVTTYITFLTPSPTANTPAVTFGGTTFTLTPDSPVTAAATLAKVDAPEALETPVAAVKEEEKKRKKREAAKPEAAKEKKRGIVAQQALNAGTPSPTMLKTGEYWIRAVASPHFHEYIQTSPQNDIGTALLGSYKNAGQYNIVSGQLVSAGSDTPYYLHVEKPTDLTQRKLATWFNTTKNDYGTFAWSGDALTWSVPEIKRQNLAAWLCCEKNALFINTGAYAYQTPAGCADQTVSFISLRNRF